MNYKAFHGTPLMFLLIAKQVCEAPEACLPATTEEGQHLAILAGENAAACSPLPPTPAQPGQ